MLPPRVGDIGVVGFTVRPFFALGNLGGGVLSEVYSRWHGKDHWFAEAQLAPAAFGVGNPGTFATTAMKAVGGYDGPVLAVGIGIGLPVFSWDDAQVGDGLLLIPQYARLGAADGAHLAFEPVFSLGANTIDFFGFTGRIQLPVGGRSWLTATGSGAPMYGYGEIGVRHLIRGNGTQDSLIVTVTTGGGAVFGRVRRNEELRSFGIGGPMVGFGMEWRN